MDLPTFTPQTRVFVHGSEGYKQHSYQYGTSSHIDGSMEPAVIIYPKTVGDVISAVKYAGKNKLGVAVRTGGHQYSGTFLDNPPFYLAKVRSNPSELNRVLFSLV